jgi:hypothetical protein
MAPSPIDFVRRLLGLHQHLWEAIEKHVAKVPVKAQMQGSRSDMMVFRPSSFTRDVLVITFKCQVCGKERVTRGSRPFPRSLQRRGLSDSPWPMPTPSG